MTDKSIIDPMGSSYSLAEPSTATHGEIPTMSMERTLPRQVSTGSTRGIQTVGYGNTKIDGTNNTITIGTPDGGTIGFGAIPNSSTNEFGFFSEDSGGNLIMKIVDGTFYTYDPVTHKNVVQLGILPNGVGGVAAANEGFEVADGFAA